MTKNNQENWRILNEELGRQNDDPYIDCMREFMKVSHRMGRYLDDTLNVEGMYRTQKRILFFMLSRNKPVIPTEISRKFHLTVDSITTAINGLDKMGLTRSYRSRADRRVRKVTLTAEGFKMIEKLLPLRRSALTQLLSDFSEEEIGVFLDFFQRIFDQLGHHKEQLYGQ